MDLRLTTFLYIYRLKVDNLYNISIYYNYYWLLYIGYNQTTMHQQAVSLLCFIMFKHHMTKTNVCVYYYCNTVILLSEVKGNSYYASLFSFHIYLQTIKIHRVILIIQFNTKHWQYECGYTPDQSCD